MTEVLIRMKDNLSVVHVVSLSCIR